MIDRPRALSLLVAATLLTVAAGAGAAPLDPFRPAGGTARPTLDPFRVAQAQPAPKPKPPAPAPAPAGSRACHVDEDCPEENICSNGTCQAIQVSTNILYLYYREGSFTEIMGLYWAKRGRTSGYTIVAPVWWHFWSPTSQTRIVAPFFWRFEDYAKQSVLTVIVPGLPISWSSEPGARSIGVWPLFYASTKFGWAAWPFGTFSLYNPDTGRGFGAALFLYWWRRTPERQLDVAIPLFYSSRSKDSAFTYVVPLNFFWRDRDVQNILVLPLFYGYTYKKGSAFYTLFGYDKQEGNWRSGSVLWLYWFAHDEKGPSGHDVLFPLIWDFRGGNSRTTVVFPLVWHFREGDSTTSVVANWLHLRRGTWRFDTVFPLWWSSSDEGRAFRALLPLFYWETSAHGRNVSFLSLLFYYHRDDDERAKTLVLPLIFYRRDPVRTLSIFTPFYIRHRAHREDSTTRFIGLLLYLRDDGQGSTTAVLPLYWRFRDAQTGATAWTIFPFYGHRSGPRDETTFVGPFYWRRFVAGGWSAGVFPLLYFGQNAGVFHAVVFPLFWHFGGERTSTTVAAPFFYRHRDPRSSAWGVPVALTFSGEKDGESYTFQIPLFWHFASQRRGWSTTVTPIGYFHSDSDGSSLGVGPLLPIVYLRWGAKRSHAVVFPLYWHFRDETAQRTSTVALLFWHRSWGGETTDAVFPFFYYRRGARPGGAPETSFTVFPLVHYRKDAKTSALLTPLGGYLREPHREAGFIGPYFWYRNDEMAFSFIPLLHTEVEHRATGERTRQWGPWFQIDAPGRKSRVLFPLWGHYEDERETDTFVFPSYFRQRRRDGGSIDALLPFYWHSSYGARSTTVIGLYYRRDAPDLHNRGVVPFWFYGKNDRRSYTIIPPVLFAQWRSNDGRYERTYCILYWHTRDGSATSTTIFPIWWAADRDGRSHQVLFPVFWRFKDEPAKSSWTLAGPVYVSRYGTRTTAALLPFFWMARDQTVRAGATLLFPVFWESHGPDQFSFFTALFGYRRTPTARLIYSPIWISYTDKMVEANTTVVPPLLHVKRTTPEESFSTALLLFWRYQTIDSSTSIGFPFLYDEHDFHLARTTVFLPFFVRYQRDTDNNVWWVGPLFYRHWTPTDSTTVGFPLLWDFKRGADRTTLVLPFYAHWRRPGYEGTYVFPNIYHRQGLTRDGTPDGTWRYLVVPFYDAAVKRPGDFMWEVLGGLFGHERIGRNRYLKVFFMTFEQKPAPRAQTAWFSKPRPVPKKQAPRGLAMTTW